MIGFTIEIPDIISITCGDALGGCLKTGPVRERINRTPASRGGLYRMRRLYTRQERPMVCPLAEIGPQGQALCPPDRVLNRQQYAIVSRPLRDYLRTRSKSFTSLRLSVPEVAGSSACTVSGSMVVGCA